MLERATNTRTLLTASIMAVTMTGMMIVGCSEEEGKVVGSAQPTALDIPSIGEIHNEVLQAAYASASNETEANNSASGGSSFDSLFAKGNLTLRKNGIDTLTREEALQAVDLGVRWKHGMLMLPEGTESILQVILGTIPAEDNLGKIPASVSSQITTYFTQYVEILQVFVEEGRSPMEAYDSTVAILGAPEYGSSLANFMDIIKHSATFWFEHYRQSWGTGGGATAVALEQTWSNFWRIVADVAIDAGSGVLAGAGYGSLGGPGGAAAGAVIGAVVGALSSYGADAAITAD